MNVLSAKDCMTVVKNLDKCISDPRYKGGKPRTQNNEIESYAGGMSMVFPINVGNKTIAVRCFHKSVANMHKRYHHVAAYLRGTKLPYFVDFEYVDNGVEYKNQRYPFVYMEWVVGHTLSDFLNDNINNSKLISKVADCFQQMTASLHSHKVAHGDLQDGNILVVQPSFGALQLTLIDYDSVHVPALKGFLDEIAGVPEYQHPQRAQNQKSTEKLDYFSELVIYLSLSAYAEDPSLWTTKQSEKLLFSAEDFDNPSKSARFRQLRQKSSRIQFLSERLAEFCTYKSIEQLVPLEVILTDSEQVVSNPFSVNFDFKQKQIQAISKPKTPSGSLSLDFTSSPKQSVRPTITQPPQQKTSTGGFNAQGFSIPQQNINPQPAIKIDYSKQNHNVVVNTATPSASSSTPISQYNNSANIKKVMILILIIAVIGILILWLIRSEVMSGVNVFHDNFYFTLSSLFLWNDSDISTEDAVDLHYEDNKPPIPEIVPALLKPATTILPPQRAMVPTATPSPTRSRYQLQP